MALPTLCPFTGTNATAIIGATTDSFGGTGTFTFVSIVAGTNTPQILSNTAYAGGSGTNTIFGYDAGATNLTIDCKIVALAFSIVVFDSTSNGSTRLEVWPESTRIRVFNESLTLQGTYTGTVNANDVVTVVTNGSLYTVYLNGVACTGLINLTRPHPTNQYVGLRCGSGTSQWDNINVAAYVATNPSTVLTYATPSSMVFTVNPGSWGSGSYTIQWEESATADGTFVSVTGGSGGTTTVYTDNRVGLARGTTYYRRPKVTDTLSAVRYGNVQSGTLWGTPLIPGMIGDSQTAPGNGHLVPWPDWFARFVAVMGYQRQVTWTENSGGSVPYGQNRAVGGTSDDDWKSGSASLNSAIIAYNTAGVTVAFVMLGTNGSAILSTYLTNMASIATALLAGVASLTKVVFVQSPSFMSYTGGSPDPASVTKVNTRNAGLLTLDNGTTIRTIGAAVPVVTGDRENSLLDGNGTGSDIHLNETGSRNVGAIVAMDYVRMLGEVGGGAVPMIGSPLIRSLQ